MSNDPTDGFSEKRRERPQEPPLPARSSRRFDEYDDRPPPRRSSSGSGSGPLKVILIVVGVVLLVTLLCGGGGVALLLYSVQKVRNAASKMASSNNMKQMGLAMHNYESAYGHMPASLPTKDGKPGLSWRVAILPFIEHEHLYRQFKLDEPWDSPHNIKLANQMPIIFRNPRSADPMNQTCYRVFVGGGAMFEHGKKTKFSSFGKPDPNEITLVDGSSTTFMIVEATDTVPWTKPDELVYQPNGSLPSLGPASETNFLVCFADGAVRAIPKDTAAKFIHGSITANGGDAGVPP